MKINSQRGATLTTTIIAIFIGGFFLTLVFKLGPHYLDNRIVAGSLEQVGQSGLQGQSSTDIRRKIGDFFTINNIRDISASKVKIKRSPEGVVLSLDYEKRVELFANVDVVLKFSDQFNSAEQTD
jgi:hypothetical protein